MYTHVHIYIYSYMYTLYMQCIHPRVYGHALQLEGEQKLIIDKQHNHQTNNNHHLARATLSKRSA